MASARADAARKAVTRHAPKSMDEDMSEYLANTLASLAEEDDADLASAKPDFCDAAMPLFEDLGLSEEAAAALCEQILVATFGGGDGGGSSRGAKTSTSDGAGSAAAADRLCYCPNLLLMYGGSPVPLLKNATLELVRGRRYGVIGANGTGKTTMMARIASKDIGGFPQDVRVVHLRHEAILRGVDPSITAREFARRKHAACAGGDLTKALSDVGFDNEALLEKSVGTLSGGWQMRLALACAMAEKANLYLLDEPTNHLDIEAVRWLADFINRVCVSGGAGVTAIIVSHDSAFLNMICTDIIHFTADAKLTYHPGNFDAFKTNVLGGDEAKAERLLEVGPTAGGGDGAGAGAGADGSARASGATGAAGGGAAGAPPESDRLVFPTPERIKDGSREERPVVLTLSDMAFRHAGAEQPLLSGINVEVHSGCRISIVGKNGSGKSTLLSLLARRLEPTGGELWTHSALRLVYISQHHEKQLGDFMSCTPYEYIQLRFKRGYDSEAPRRLAPVLDRKQETRMKQVAKMHGKRGKEVEAIVSRSINLQTKICLYEVKWKDLSLAENTFEKFERLKGLCVEHLVHDFNQMMMDAWGEAQERPLSDKEIVRHLEDFGLPEDAARHRRIGMLSSGQKSKLMLAASFWTMPHIVCLDEPTNYLDADTIKNLTQALCKFKGGYIVVSHNQEFVDDISEEIWEVADGKVAIRPAAKAAATAAAGATAAAAAPAAFAPKERVAKRK